MSFHMGGVVSGWDTQAMIESLIEAERIPIYRAENEIYKEEMKLAAWSMVDSAMTTLNSKAQSLTNYSTWNQVNTTSTDESVATGYASSSNATGVYDVNITQLAKSQRIASDPQAAIDTELALSGDFTIGGQTVTVESTDTLEDIRNAINDAALNMDDEEKVRASIIGTTLVIEREQTGDVDISISDGTNSVLESLGIVEADGTTVRNELQTSEDLAGTVNGIAITNTTNTGITDILSGVTLNFYDEGTATITVGRDTDSVKALLQDFIDAYNSAMDELEEQSKVDLSNSGEEITDTGILQGDGSIATMQSRSRMLITSRERDTNILDEDFKSLQSIGIWTSDRDNRLSIVDAATLDNALQNNFEEVQDLIRDWDAGVVRKLYDYTSQVTDPIDGTLVVRQNTLNTSISRRNEEIMDMESYLVDYEQELWEQFARMEESLSQIQGQGNYLLNAMGAGSTTKK